MGKKTHGPYLIHAIETNNHQKVFDLLTREIRSKEKRKEICTSDLKRMGATDHVDCPLMCAALLPDPSIIQFMCGKLEVNVNFIYEDRAKKRTKRRTALIVAVSHGLYDTVEALLTLNADPNISDHKGRGSLHHAVRKADYRMTKMLLTRGAQANLSDRSDNTPLHIATIFGHVEMTKVLLQYGGDLYKKGQHGSIPIHMASREGHASLVRLFCQHEVNPNIRVPCYDEREKAPLHVAAEHGHVETIVVLAEYHGASVNVQDSEGETPLHCAVLNEYDPLGMKVKEDYTDVVKVLIKLGAEVNIQNGRGETALHLAARNEFHKIVDLLVQVGCDPILEDNDKNKAIDLVSEGDTVTKNTIKAAMRDRESILSNAMEMQARGYTTSLNVGPPRSQSTLAMTSVGSSGNLGRTVSTPGLFVAQSLSKNYIHEDGYLQPLGSRLGLANGQANQPATGHSRNASASVSQGLTEYAEIDVNSLPTSPKAARKPFGSQENLLKHSGSFESSSDSSQQRVHDTKSAPTQVRARMAPKNTATSKEPLTRESKASEVSSFWDVTPRSSVSTFRGDPKRVSQESYYESIPEEPSGYQTYANLPPPGQTVGGRRPLQFLPAPSSMPVGATLHTHSVSEVSDNDTMLDSTFDTMSTVSQSTITSKPPLLQPLSKKLSQQTMGERQSSKAEEAEPKVKNWLSHQANMLKQKDAGGANQPLAHSTPPSPKRKGPGVERMKTLQETPTDSDESEVKRAQDDSQIRSGKSKNVPPLPPRERANSMDSLDSIKKRPPKPPVKPPKPVPDKSQAINDIIQNGEKDKRLRLEVEEPKEDGQTKIRIIPLDEEGQPEGGTAATSQAGKGSGGSSQSGSPQHQALQQQQQQQQQQQLYLQQQLQLLQQLQQQQQLQEQQQQQQLQQQLQQVQQQQQALTAQQQQQHLQPHYQQLAPQQQMQLQQQQQFQQQQLIQQQQALMLQQQRLMHHYQQQRLGLQLEYRKLQEQQQQLQRQQQQQQQQLNQKQQEESAPQQPQQLANVKQPQQQQLEPKKQALLPPKHLRNVNNNIVKELQQVQQKDQEDTYQDDSDATDDFDSTFDTLSSDAEGSLILNEDDAAEYQNTKSAHKPALKKPPMPLSFQRSLPQAEPASPLKTFQSPQRSSTGSGPTSPIVEKDPFLDPADEQMTKEYQFHKSLSGLSAANPDDIEDTLDRKMVERTISNASSMSMDTVIFRGEAPQAPLSPGFSDTLSSIASSPTSPTSPKVFQDEPETPTKPVYSQVTKAKGGKKSLAKKQAPAPKAVAHPIPVPPKTAAASEEEPLPTKEKDKKTKKEKKTKKKKKKEEKNNQEQSPSPAGKEQPRKPSETLPVETAPVRAEPVRKPSDHLPPFKMATVNVQRSQLPPPPPDPTVNAYEEIPEKYLSNRESNGSMKKVTIGTEQIIPTVPRKPKDHDHRQITYNSNGRMPFSVVGGNVDGVFVHRVAGASDAQNRGITNGDQILQVNGQNLKGKTREDAFLLLSSLKEDVTLLVRNRKDKYQSVVDSGGTGDAFFVRAHFRQAPMNPGELAINEGDIFSVRDTLPDGKSGAWRALKVNAHAKESQHGLIPNKRRAEQIALAIRLEQPSSRRRGGLFTRSFGRSKSVDRLNRERDRRPSAGSMDVVAYERVVQRAAEFKRPVVLLGLFCDVVRDMIVEDNPQLFDLPMQEIEINPGMGTDDDHREVVNTQVIRSIVSQDKHCLMIISPRGIDYLRKTDLNPIVIYLTPGNKVAAKYICGRLAPGFKMKPAHMVDEAQTFEKRHAQLFTAVVPYQADDSWFTVLKETIHGIQNENQWVRAPELDYGDDTEDSGNSPLHQARDRQSRSRGSVRSSIKTTDDIPDQVQSMLARHGTMGQPPASPPGSPQTQPPPKYEGYFLTDRNKQRSASVGDPLNQVNIMNYMDSGDLSLDSEPRTPKSILKNRSPQHNQSLDSSLQSTNGQMVIPGRQLQAPIKAQPRVPRHPRNQQLQQQHLQVSRANVHISSDWKKLLRKVLCNKLTLFEVEILIADLEQRPKEELGVAINDVLHAYAHSDAIIATVKSWENLQMKSPTSTSCPSSPFEELVQPSLVTTKAGHRLL